MDLLFAFVKMSEPAVQAALGALGNSWSLEWDGGGWTLLRVNRRLWRAAKSAPNTIAVAVPHLARPTKSLPPAVLNRLGAEGVVVQADDTILETLVRLTGNEELGI
jgi:hypothetical protein